MVRQFAAGLNQRIAAMSVAISEGTFPIGRFQQFLIRDPKERVITAPCFDGTRAASCDHERLRARDGSLVDR